MSERDFSGSDGGPLPTMQRHETHDGLPCPGTCVTMAGELEDLRAEVKELKAKTYCAYCHEEFPLDTVTAKQVTEHVRTCERASSTR